MEAREQSPLDRIVSVPVTPELPISHRTRAQSQAIPNPVNGTTMSRSTPQSETLKATSRKRTEPHRETTEKEDVTDPAQTRARQSKPAKNPRGHLPSYIKKGNEILVFVEREKNWVAAVIVEANPHEEMCVVKYKDTQRTDKVKNADIRETSKALLEQMKKERARRKEVDAKKWNGSPVNEAIEPCAISSSADIRRRPPVAASRNSSPPAQQNELSFPQESEFYYLNESEWKMVHKSGDTTYLLFPLGQRTGSEDRIVLFYCCMFDPTLEALVQIDMFNLDLHGVEGIIEVKGKRRVKEEGYEYVYDDNVHVTNPTALYELVSFYLDPRANTFTFRPTSALVPGANAETSGSICDWLKQTMKLNKACRLHDRAETDEISDNDELILDHVAEFTNVLISMGMAVEWDRNVHEAELNRENCEPSVGSSSPEHHNEDLYEQLRQAKNKQQQLEMALNDLCDNFKKREKELEDEYAKKTEQLFHRVEQLEQVVNGFVSAARPSNIRVQPETEDHMKV